MQYFISDTHFCDSRPEHLESFLHFCRNQLTHRDTLILLGDIFEVWVGDDIISEVANQVETELLMLQKRGIDVYFMAGNRDFLVSKQFAKRTGCTLLKDPSIWTLANGEKCLLTHGDLFCTHDTGYRRFRAITRNWCVQQLFLLLPKSTRLKIAKSMRMASKNSQKDKNANLLDVSNDLVKKMFNRFPNINLIIMGHTHRPNIHSDFGKTRAVLGDWNNYVWIGIAEKDKRFMLQRNAIDGQHIETVYSA